MSQRGVKNGALLVRAAAEVDAFLTVDRNLRHQRNLAGLDVLVIVLHARSHRMHDLLPLVAEVAQALAADAPGDVRLGGRR